MARASEGGEPNLKIFIIVRSGRRKAVQDNLGIDRKKFARTGIRSSTECRHNIAMVQFELRLATTNFV